MKRNHAPVADVEIAWTEVSEFCAFVHVSYHQQYQQACGHTYLSYFRQRYA